jgi:hypothetical protein
VTDEQPERRSEQVTRPISIQLSETITSNITQQLSELGAELSAHVAERMTPLIRDFRVELTPFFDRMRPTFEGLATAARAAMPPNWEEEEIGTELLLRRGELIQTTGVPLVWVPDTAIVWSLEKASNDNARADVLRVHQRTILESCRDCLSEILHPGLRFLAESTYEAAESMKAGRNRAAQALATAAIDTAYTRLLEHRTSARARKEFTKELRDQSLTAIRFALVVAAIPPALKAFGPTTPIPTRYNRHATFHAVTPEQYSDTNALIAVMLASSCLREWDLFLTRRDQTRGGN